MSDTRLVYTVREACEALRLGRSKLYQLINAGEVETVKIGSSTRLKAESVHRLAETGTGKEAGV